jgi:hypothetical protein
MAGTSSSALDDSTRNVVDQERATAEARRRADAAGEPWVVFSSDDVTVPVRTTFGAWAIAPARTAGDVAALTVWPSSAPAGPVTPDPFFRFDNLYLWLTGVGVLGVIGVGWWLLRRT